LFGVWQHWLAGLFAARILAGIFSSASLSVAQAYVADVTKPEDRATGMGMIGAAFGVGFILGPAIGGVLGRIHLGLPMYLASALAIANALYIARYLPESRTAAERKQSVSAVSPMARLGMMGRLLTGPIGFLFVLTFLVTFGFAILEGVFTPYLVQHFGYARQSSVGVAGGVFAYIGFLIVLIQGGAIRPLVKRFGEPRLVVTGIFLLALGFLTFALPHHLWALMLGPMIPLSVGNGINSPSLRSLISRATSADAQGGTLGLTASFDSLARALGPAFGGLLYSHCGQTAPFWSAGVILAVAFVFAAAQANRLTGLADIHSGVLSQPEVGHHA
jgi:MFS family permease